MAGYMTGTVIPVDGGLLDRERVDGKRRKEVVLSVRRPFTSEAERAFRRQ